jgi:hypothetical protein
LSSKRGLSKLNFFSFKYWEREMVPEDVTPTVSYPFLGPI